MENLISWLITHWDYFGWALSLLLTFLMWASQVDPSKARSNISTWFAWTPEFFSRLASVVANKWSLRTIFCAVISLVYALGYSGGQKSVLDKPAPLPEKIYIPSPSAAPPAPVELRPNIPAPLPVGIGELGGRYLLLDELIALTHAITQQLQECGQAARDVMKPAATIEAAQTRCGGVAPPKFNQRFSLAQGELRDINNRAYVNRPVDFETIPELVIPTNEAPDEDAFNRMDGAARYAYRVMHFRVVNAVKQGQSLLTDMRSEKSRVEGKLKETAQGQPFLKAAASPR
jgi:hypothetical protein